MKDLFRLRFKNTSYLLPLLAAIFVFSSPVFAYEEDTHFQMTYVICRSVGFTPEEALIVAAVDQGMDDSDNTVANHGPGGLIPQVEQEWKWHALDLEGKFHSAVILTRRNGLFQLALKESDLRNKLIRLGIFFHFQQDTWAHRHHYESNHLDRDNYTTYSTPLGHARDGHQPDRPPYDPVAALMNLEDGIWFASRFLKEGLQREPGAFLASYTRQGGYADTTWPKDKKYFHQISLSGAAPNSARMYLLKLISTQIEQYKSSGEDSDGANLDNMRIALEKVCKDFEPYRSAGIPNPTINIPSTAQKVAAGFTNLKTSKIESQLPLTSAITDGMRFVHLSDGASYLILDGKLRWVPDQATWTNLFETAPMRELPLPDPKYPVGAPLTKGAYLARGDKNPTIFLMVDGTKRPINENAFYHYGFNRFKIRDVSEQDLQNVRYGADINDPAWPAIGDDGSRLVNASDGKTYFVLDHQLRLVPNLETYNHLFRSDAGKTTVGSIAGYVIGPPITDGAYMAKTASNPKTYLLIDGKKRWITSEAAFNNYGFNAGNILVRSADDLGKIPDGANIP